MIGAALLFSLTAAGTLGYVAIEGMTPFDALYMTVTTISTVGFREVQPLSAAGRGFTIGLIVSGVGTAFYTFSAMAGFVIEGRLRTRAEGIALRELRDLGVRVSVVAIKRGSERIRLGPGPDEVLCRLLLRHGSPPGRVSRAPLYHQPTNAVQ